MLVDLILIPFPTCSSHIFWVALTFKLHKYYGVNLERIFFYQNLTLTESVIQWTDRQIYINQTLVTICLANHILS